MNNVNTYNSNNAYNSHGLIKLSKSTTSYTWKINSFCVNRKKTGEVIDSPIISSGADGEHRWRILLHPRGKTDEYKDYSSLFIFLMSCNESKLQCHFRFAILNDKDEQCHEKKIEQEMYRGKGTGFADFIKRDMIFDKSSSCMIDSHLSIFCEITTDEGPIKLQNPSSVSSITVSERLLSEELESLFESAKYTDLTLSVHGMEFRAHKNILAARSSVFATMFVHDSSHKIDNFVEMKNIEGDIVKEMLRFIYSGKVNNIDKIADKLLPAAEKYDLPGLKRMCEETMFRTLTIENAIDTLILADINDAQKLKTDVIGFILANSKDVVETPAYKSIAQSKQLHLLAEVLQVLSVQNH